MKINRLFSLSFLLIAPLIFISMVNAQDCPTNMISYWRFEEIGDTVFQDSYGNHDAKSPSFLTDVSSGIVGTAKYFDGTKTVNVADDPVFNFAANGSFSVALWVKFNDVTSGTYGPVFIGKNDPYSADKAYWSIGAAKTTGNLFFDLRDANNNIQSLTAGAINNNTWHFIVAVRDGSANKNRLYLDGQRVDSVSYSYSGNFVSTSDINIGYLMRSGVPNYFYTGNLDEVAIYSKALSSSEISSQYTKGLIGIGYCDGYSPSFISIPVTKAVVGEAYSYKAHATGSQTNMKYYLVTNPSGMTIDQNTGDISWTPSSGTDNAYVKVRAQNSFAPADTQSYYISVAAAPACPANMLLLLKLNETSGPVYADQEGSHDATATVSPTPTAGIVNEAQTFNATTKLNIPDNGNNEFNWNQNDDFSFEFWMKTSTTATMVAIGRHRRTDDYPDKATWWVGTNSSGKADFFLQDNAVTPNNYEITGGPTLTDNQWHHIIAVRSGSTNKNRLYVDGIRVDSVTTSYTNSFVADSITDVTVGWYDPTATGYHFIGSLDEVAIFNRAIGDAEAAAFYNNGNPTGHCAPENYPPVITSTPSTSATQDVMYSYTFTAQDPDAGDVLILSAVTKPDWLNFSWTAGQKSAVLSGTPANSDVGTANVTLRVSDGHTQKDQPFSITVQNVNDPPVITTTPVTSVNEDELYNYKLIVSDIDPSDVITFTSDTLPSWLSLNWSPGDTSAIISGTPTNDNTGNTRVNIGISDGTVTVHEAYTLTVNPIDDAPVITGQSALSIDEDHSITIHKSDLSITDVDNTLNQLTLEVYAGNNYTFVDSTVTPDLNFNGQLSVNVVVKDPYDSVSAVYPVMITVNPVNDPPVITSTADTTVVEGSLYIYVFQATDVDNTSLTMEAVQKPAWLNFTIQSNGDGLLSGTPDDTDVGKNTVILSVSDGTATVEQTIVINVHNVNDKPVITGQTSTIDLPNNETYVVSLDDLIVNDPDNTYPDDFTLTVLDGNNYTVNGDTVMPAADYTGTISVNVTVSDGIAESDVFVLTINITGPSAIIENKDAAFRVYPVPAVDKLNVELSSQQENTRIEIINSSGSLVKSMMIPKNTNKTSIETTNLKAGVYYCRISNSRINEITRFVVIK